MPAFPFFTEEHEMFRKVVDEFVERECPREAVRGWDQNREFPAGLYRKVAQQGWFGLIVPEEYGGLGADMIYYAMANEGLAKYSYDIAIGYGLVAWGVNSVLKWGTEEQKRKWLPPVLEGERRFSISITEPNAGSDAAAVALSAVDRGDHFLVNGQKLFSTGAHVPGNVIVLVTRTDASGPKHRGISVFLCPNDLEGIEFRKLPTVSRHIMGTTEIYFTDVKIPRKNLIGELDDGWRVVGSHLETERIGLAAAYTGNAQTAVNDAAKYARERKQFGRSIAEFQVLKHMLVDMQTSVDAARLMAYNAAWRYAQHMPCLREASEAKLFSSETLVDITVKGMQILGGYAQLPEYDMERYWRDAKQATVGGGTSQIQRTIIAKELGF